MKLIGKIVFGAIALLMVLGLVPAMIPDAEYSAGAREWLDIAHTPTIVAPRHNRFHAQVGLQAAVEDDMIDFGIRLVSQANRLRDENDPDFNPDWQNPPLGLSPALAELDFDAISEKPLDWLADNRSLLRQLVDENALLLERYHRLSEMTAHAITLTPDYRAPIPNYASLGKVHRLNSLAIAALVIDDSDNLERLREVIDKQRFSFADAATLIEKMVIVSMLHFDLKLYAGLLKLPGVAARHEPFPALDAEERTLRRAYIHEFAIGASLLDDGSWGTGMGAFEKILVGLYFKPRKLENHAYEHTWMRLLALESRPLAERQSPPRSSSYSWWEGYTDPIGYIMYEISRPSFNYHDRIEHLDGLITLVNSAAEIHRKSLRGDAIADYLSTVDTRAHPGYAGATLEYDGVSKALFFEIPGFESSNNPRTQDLPPRVELN